MLNNWVRSDGELLPMIYALGQTGKTLAPSREQQSSHDV